MPWTTWCVLTDFNDHHASHRASRRALWDDDGAFSSVRDEFVNLQLDELIDFNNDFNN